jgi:hypothetical protein
LRGTRGQVIGLWGQTGVYVPTSSGGRMNNCAHAIPTDGAPLPRNPDAWLYPWCHCPVRLFFERLKRLFRGGPRHQPCLCRRSSPPLAGAVTSKVDSVTLISATKATVKYDLSAMGTPVATGASGTAVLQDGVWKLGDTVFCGLLTQAKSAGISLPVPAACGSGG